MGGFLSSVGGPVPLRPCSVRTLSAVAVQKLKSAGEGDLEAARALVESTSGAELFTYAGNRHLFIDASLPSYDAEAAESCVRRVLSFLQGTF